MRLGKRLGDHHTLAGGQTVRLDHDRGAAHGHVGERRFDLAVMAEGYERVYRSLLEPMELYEDEGRDTAGLVERNGQVAPELIRPSDEEVAARLSGQTASPVATGMLVEPTSLHQGEGQTTFSGTVTAAAGGAALSGVTVTLEADGLLAVCLQHEIDHLNGKVFVQHLSRLKQSRIRAKLAKQERDAA